MPSKRDIAEWVSEYIDCIGRDVINIEEPYSRKDMEKLKVPTSQLKILYDLLHHFDIQIKRDIYHKYKRFSSLLP